MVYLDTSYLVPLVLPDPMSASIERFLHTLPAGSLSVSQWSRVEFMSLLGHQIRAKELNSHHASQAISMFEQILNDSCQVITPDNKDLKLATEILHEYYDGLNASEALHLAVAQNNHAELFLTLNKQLINAAKSYRLPTTWGI
ncbi:MAG: hypothetical protein HW411_471 [Gammaproteobacteria bacterium]|nr:hypothetical protein [Gammaproteobacteria bacterium]